MRALQHPMLIEKDVEATGVQLDAEGVTEGKVVTGHPPGQVAEPGGDLATQDDHGRQRRDAPPQP